jgi:hypothetical protein
LCAAAAAWRSPPPAVAASAERSARSASRARSEELVEIDTSVTSGSTTPAA